MTAFATIDETNPANPVVAVWDRDADTGRYRVSRIPSADDIPDGMDVHRFDVPTTSAAHGACNGSRHPVVDADGAPLWAGARIEFRVPSYYINCDAGAGTFTGVDQYSGCRFVSDRPLNVYDRSGFIARQDRQRYATVGTLAREGHDLAGHMVLAGKLGDPFEHGQVPTYIRLADDPRTVCSPVSRPAPGGAGP